VLAVRAAVLDAVLAGWELDEFVAWWEGALQLQERDTWEDAVERMRLVFTNADRDIWANSLRSHVTPPPVLRRSGGNDTPDPAFVESWGDDDDAYEHRDIEEDKDDDGEVAKGYDADDERPRSGHGSPLLPW
jgi:hypothetical protein